jgi:hypothetical protein
VCSLAETALSRRSCPQHVITAHRTVAWAAALLLQCTPNECSVNLLNERANSMRVALNAAMQKSGWWVRLGIPIVSRQQPACSSRHAGGIAQSGFQVSDRRSLIMRRGIHESGMFTRAASVKRESLRIRFGDLMRRGGSSAATRKGQASRITRRHLATLSDPILRDLGFTPDEIGLIRECRWCAYPHWHWP